MENMETSHLIGDVGIIVKSSAAAAESDEATCSTVIFWKLEKSNEKSRT
jgi:hypothetical protein